LPCDTPLINSDVLKILLNEVDKGDALIPRWESGYIEPLHAIYKINALKKSSHLFTHNPHMSIRSYISTFNEIKYIPINRLKTIDPKLYTFFNINTLDDLERVRKILLSRT
jgi:molybdopterin-guanine dinucleotide biosynthesis protein A